MTTSPFSSTELEICLPALRGECRGEGEGSACPNIHASNRGAAQWELDEKETTRVCADHLRDSCSRGHACCSLHVRPERAIPTIADVAAESLRRNNASKQGKPGRPRVPRAVRLASQVRGKAKRLEEMTAIFNRLAQATGPSGVNAQRARDALCQKAAFEVELEDLVARLEVAIQNLYVTPPPAR